MSVYSPAVWFQDQPVRSLLVACAFMIPAGIARWRRGGKAGRALGIASAAWALYALNEYIANRQRADIRLDLVLFWPALVVVTALCLFFEIKWAFSRRGSGPGPLT